jgi:hypothetical protein
MSSLCSREGSVFVGEIPLGTNRLQNTYSIVINIKRLLFIHGIVWKAVPVRTARKPNSAVKEKN